MAHKTQNYGNHARIVPAYHFLAFGILVVNLIWTGIRVFRAMSFDSVLACLLALALLLIFFYARLFALTVQDRVIRLEMRLRLSQMLPPELRPRINDFTVPQLVGLRFASDAELPDLARKVLTDNIDDRNAIKKMVRDWQADVLRA